MSDAAAARLWCLVGVLAVFATHAPSVAEACATAVELAAPPVEIHREEALIVWNEATKEEHFIRRAVFDTSARTFAFLVPTPSRPALAEASAALFDELRAATKPEVVEKNKWNVVTATDVACSPFMRRSASSKAAAPAVSVLEETRVAGMDATVLAATDTDALAKWLGEHGFPFRPALRDWLAPYIEAGFTLTVFQYTRPDVAANAPLGLAVPVAPTAVRLSFKSDRAFYPYREPVDAPAVSGRKLHLFLIATGRVDALLGAGAGSRWSTSELLFANALQAGPALAGSLAGVVPPEGAWLTEFVDSARTRARDDVFFTKSKTTDRVVPPPVIHITGERSVFLPLDLMALVAGALYLWRRRKKRQAR